MRTASRNLVSTIGVGILGFSYFIGTQTASTALDVANNAGATPTPSATPTATPTSTASATPTPSSSASRSASSNSTSSGSSTSKASGTRSASENYIVEGDRNVVQLAVTMKNGKITNVDYSGSTATEGRSVVFGDLAQAAIDANGTRFGNISGATYTVNAFKSALKAALAKF